MSKSISIIDYGMSNLLSISRAFEHVDAKVNIISSPEEILKADYLVLPGVGAFPDGMEHLNSRNFTPAIREFALSGKPLLGVCLGMQMLLSKGNEHHITAGLDIIKGECLPLPKDMPNFKVPNVNWHSIYPPNEQSWSDSVLDTTQIETCFYFVHSYYAAPILSSDILALSRFGTLNFAAAVKHENVIGTQFHPEKSGEAGLHLLKRFTQL
ncbi:MAG: imidazole glycerol phosphate synthase subunit HisH [Bacteroidia bacterium]|nr:imidazole glycerol phosphate synthase subunit HisH [Bacteroidia bacterium]